MTESGRLSDDSDDSTDWVDVGEDSRSHGAPDVWTCDGGAPNGAFRDVSGVDGSSTQGNSPDTDVWEYQDARRAALADDAADTLRNQEDDGDAVKAPSISRKRLPRQRYTYDSLADDEIRVFQMVPGHDMDSPIQGNVREIKIPPYWPTRGRFTAYRNLPDDWVDYEAMSYAWGPTYVDGSHLTDSIVCEGCLLPVTPNLRRALQRLRAGNWRMQREYHYNSEDEFGRVHRLGVGEWPYETPMNAGLPLWIDAICIDQGNPEERSAQVAKMHWIFRRAYAITVWLGEPQDGAVGEAQLELFDSRKRPEEAVVESLLELPWFHRRWVVQEVSSSGNCYAVRMGANECSYRTIYDCVRAHGLSHRAGALWLRTRPLTLLQTLWTYRHSECFDPLDRIYALRSLASDGERVRVDYSRDVRNVYMEAALAVTVEFAASHQEEAKGNVRELLTSVPLPFEKIHSAEMLRLLALATCFKSIQRSNTDRSEHWVPDWRAEATFESSQHEEAVEGCARNTCAFDNNQSMVDLPIGIAGAESGHVYLHVRGLMFSRSAAGRSNEAIARMLRNDALKPQTLSDITDPHDMIWIPWFGAVGQINFQGREKQGVGFVLRSGETASSLDDKPVFRHRHCFLLSSVLSTADIDSLASVADMARQDNQAGRNIWAEFYLE